MPTLAVPFSRCFSWHIPHVFTLSFPVSFRLVAFTFYSRSLFNRAPRGISHARTRTARSLARSRLRHARLTVAVARRLVLVHLCTMCTTYGFLIVGSPVAFARERASITIIARRRIGSRFVGPRRPAFAARAFNT